MSIILDYTANEVQGESEKGNRTKLSGRSKEMRKPMLGTEKG